MSAQALGIWSWNRKRVYFMFANTHIDESNKSNWYTKHFTVQYINFAVLLNILHASNDACYSVCLPHISVLLFQCVCITVYIWYKFKSQIAKSQTTHTHMPLPTYLKIMLISLKSNHTHWNSILIFIDSFFTANQISAVHLSCKYK